MIEFKIVPDDGDPYTLESGTRDVYMWEKTNKGKVFSQAMDNLAMVDLYEIAYFAARRQGYFTGSLREFTDSCELEIGGSDDQEEGEGAGPFDPAPSAETSSPSPSSRASRRASGPKKANKR